MATQTEFLPPSPDNWWDRQIISFVDREYTPEAFPYWAPAIRDLLLRMLLAFSKSAEFDELEKETMIEMG